MRSNYRFFFALPFLIALTACRPHFQYAQTDAKYYRISADTLTAIDSVSYRLILPYKLHLDSLMSVAVVQSADEFKKELPCGTLNNLFCDLLLQYVQKQHKEAPMICVMNYGGIRLPYFPKGTITVGKVYELMPFDNELVLAETDGKTIQLLAERIASTGGEPVAGLRMQIQGDKPAAIAINGEPLKEEGKYFVLLSDYMANGGDGYGFIKQKAISLIPLGVKVREALLEQMKTMNTRGEQLKAVADGRIQKN